MVENNSRKFANYLITIPNLHLLISVKVEISKNEKRDRSALSNYHWQILKSRQMIFEIPEILVAKPNEKLCLYVIMQKEFYNSGLLQNYMNAHNLKLISENHVTPTLFKMSFEYTLYARLSPIWNPVGQYLIKGKQFLLDKGRLDAIQITFSCDGEKLFVFVKGFTVMLPPPDLNDFGIDRELIKLFKEKQMESIDVPLRQIFKLPNMLPGQIISIHNNIPKTCPLKTYNDLRRHWKNMYGYRLPDSDANIFYVNIRIKLFGSWDYKTYPNVCGRLYTIQYTGASSSKTIVESFLTSIATKIRTCCEHPVRILSCTENLLSVGLKKVEPTPDDTQHISLCTPTPAIANLRRKTVFPTSSEDGIVAKKQKMEKQF